MSVLLFVRQSIQSFDRSRMGGAARLLLSAVRVRAGDIDRQRRLSAQQQQRRRRSTGLQQGAQQQMRAVPRFQLTSEAEHRLV